jgi:hemolysin III
VQHFREPFCGLTHLAAAILAAAGLGLLVLLASGDPACLPPLLIYGLSLVLLFASSAAYHLVRGPDRLLLALKRLDHAAIFAFIAGTYTPFTCNLLTGAWRWGLLAAIWALAAAGVAVKLSLHRKSNHLGTLAYLGMGWLGAIALPQLARRLPWPGIALLAAGGLAYSLGTLLYSADLRQKHPRANLHGLWHLVVMAAAALHFAAIAFYLTCCPAARLKC